MFKENYFDKLAMEFDKIFDNIFIINSSNYIYYFYSKNFQDICVLLNIFRNV